MIYVVAVFNSDFTQQMRIIAGSKALDFHDVKMKQVCPRKSQFDFACTLDAAEWLFRCHLDACGVPRALTDYLRHTLSVSVSGELLFWEEKYVACILINLQI